MIRPLSGRIVIRQDAPMEKIGNILLPENSQQKPRQGTVVAIADDPWMYENGVAEPIECRVGDYVLYSKFSGIIYKEHVVLAGIEVCLVMPKGETDPMNGKLLSGRIMVEPDEPISRTRGGIILPDQAKEKPRSGKAVKVAKTPYRYITGHDVPIEVKEGDKLLYGRMAGIEFRDATREKDYLILMPQDVYAVL